MTPEMIEQAVKAERTYTEGQVLLYGERMSAVPRMEALLQTILQVAGAEDVGTIDLGWDYEQARAQVTLYLTKPDSFLPREVVKALHTRFTKKPFGEGLACLGEIDGLTLGIYGYLPESCAIVYETVTVPSHTERKPKVVCALLRR